MQITLISLLLLASTQAFLPCNLVGRALNPSARLRVVSSESSEGELSFDEVKNARDLASADGAIISPNCLFRTGMLSNASPADAEKISNELNLKTLVDLRSLTELKTDDGLNSNPVFGEYVDIRWSSVRSAREVLTKEKYDGKSEKVRPSKGWSEATAAYCRPQSTNNLLLVASLITVCQEEGAPLCFPHGREEVRRWNLPAYPEEEDCEASCNCSNHGGVEKDEEQGEGGVP